MSLFRRTPLPEPVEFTDADGSVTLSLPHDVASGLASALFPLLMKHGQITITFGAPVPSQKPLDLRTLR